MSDARLAVSNRTTGSPRFTDSPSFTIHLIWTRQFSTTGTTNSSDRSDSRVPVSTRVEQKFPLPPATRRHRVAAGHFPPGREEARPGRSAPERASFLDRFSIQGLAESLMTFPSFRVMIRPA